MISTFTCLHCGQEVPRNPRLKQGQKYCSRKECQRARMRSWKKERYENSNSYRQKCLDSQKRWRKKRPGHQYQREYRKEHPEYVIRNRELQRKRNEKRQQTRPIDITKKIVNRNTLTGYPREAGVYALMPVKGGKIVNRNTLMVRMQLLS